MNKSEMAVKISERSEVSLEDSKKALDALENILSEELENSDGIGGAFDKVYKLLSTFKGRKEEK